MSGFLLDTNVLSELTRPNPDPKILNWLNSIDEDLVYLSVLTLGEIRRGIELLTSAKKRAQLEAWLESDVRIRFEARILDVDRSVANRWGALLAKSKVKGRPLPVIDGLLIATALDHDLTFVSRHTSGAIAAGVSVFNPWG